MTQKREFCSCHLLVDVVGIFCKGGHIGGGGDQAQTRVFCPSFNLVQTLTREVKGYPVGNAVGVVF